MLAPSVTPCSQPKEGQSYILMSNNGSITIWLESLHATSSLLGPWHLCANYSAGKTIKDEVLSTGADVYGNVFKLQMMNPSAKMLGHSRNFKPLVTVRTHLERLLCRQGRCVTT